MFMSFSIPTWDDPSDADDWHQGLLRRRLQMEQLPTLPQLRLVHCWLFCMEEPARSTPRERGVALTVGEFGPWPLDPNCQRVVIPVPAMEMLEQLEGHGCCV
eukprot:s1492_g1.t1